MSSEQLADNPLPSMGPDVPVIDRRRITTDTCWECGGLLDESDEYLCGVCADWVIPAARDLMTEMLGEA